jgi:hypothetical protein
MSYVYRVGVAQPCQSCMCGVGNGWSPYRGGGGVDGSHKAALDGVGLHKILERLPSTGDPGLLAMGVLSATVAVGLAVGVSVVVTEGC